MYPRIIHLPSPPICTLQLLYCSSADYYINASAQQSRAVYPIRLSPTLQCSIFAPIQLSVPLLFTCPFDSLTSEAPVRSRISPVQVLRAAGGPVIIPTANSDFDSPYYTYCFRLYVFGQGNAILLHGTRTLPILLPSHIHFVR